MDWLDLLAVQGTLKSLLQHHSSKASILWSSAFLIVQLSHLYMTIGKNIGLTRRTSACILSPCLFNLYAEYIMQNARLNETQAGIKIAGRNINNLRFAEDNTLMAKSEEELKSLLLKVKEENEKVGLKLNIQKTNMMASGPIISWQNRWGNNGNSERLYFGRLQNHCRW